MQPKTIKCAARWCRQVTAGRSQQVIHIITVVWRAVVRAIPLTARPALHFWRAIESLLVLAGHVPGDLLALVRERARGAADLVSQQREGLVLGQLGHLLEVALLPSRAQ